MSQIISRNATTDVLLPPLPEAAYILPGVERPLELETVRSLYAGLSLDDLSDDFLHEITRRYSVDMATSLLFDRVCRRSENIEFLNAIQQLSTDGGDVQNKDVHIVLLPAAFYAQHPQYGGDGRLVKATARALDLPYSLVPVESLDGLETNARIIADFLPSISESRIVIVSLSKGSADLRYAFECGWIKEPRLRHWIQICGMHRGTPLIDEVYIGGKIKGLIKSGFMKMSGATSSMVEDLAAKPPGYLSREFRTPAGVKLINVMGFPMRAHVSGSLFLKIRHRRLSRYGPNDGFVLLRDAIIEPGLICPVLGADHYFQEENLDKLLAALLRYVCAGPALA